MEETLTPAQQLAKAMQSIQQCVREVMVPWWKRLVKIITDWWKPIKNRLLYLRHHGTHQQRRYAWKLLHPPMRRKLRTRISHD